MNDSKRCVVDHSGQFKSVRTLIAQNDSLFYDEYSY
jgi:hypothetical protein